VSTPPVFPNPEREWERAADLATLDRREVERRIGPTQASLELLSGGRANVNVRVGADRVLRIYRRDRDARAREQWLLQRGWQSFVTPTIQDAGDGRRNDADGKRNGADGRRNDADGKRNDADGRRNDADDDFLVLDYIAHGPLLATAEHGTVVGRALAEIHRTRFGASGLLAPRPGVRDTEPETTLDVSAPFGDVADAFRKHARAELARARWLDDGLRSAVNDLLLANADVLRREAASPVLLHGDFKASNLHWTSDSQLLVLDWEFAYAGPALMDIGQLLRWSPPSPFVDAFANGYAAHGGVLPPNWKRLAEIFDLVNLAGLAANADDRSARARDITRRLAATTQNHSV
jgi:fructosamine-3-kinase